MHKQIAKQATSDRKIKENIEIYIWIDLFAYMCMHIVNTQAQTHAQIHIHTQIPASVQLPTLFQPRVPSLPSTHLHRNQAPGPATISINPPVSAETLIVRYRISYC